MVSSSANILVITACVCIVHCALVDKYYFSSTQTFTWIQAQKYCQQTFGTDLASIHSKEDMDNIDAIVNWRSAWIGLHDRIEEETFVWQDGTTFDYGLQFEVYPWTAGRPNNLNNEDCILYETAGTWNDLDCSSHTDFLLCNKPSLLCNVDIDWTLSDNQQWSFSNCTAKSWNSGGVAIMDSVQWMKDSTDEQVVIEYMFSVQNVNQIDDGATSGILVYNLRSSPCLYYYIGISPSSSTIFIRKLSEDGAMIELATSSSINYTLGNYYPLQVTVKDTVFVVSIHGIQYINYNETDANLTEFMYIGLMNSDLNISAKSLYVSGEQISSSLNCTYKQIDTHSQSAPAAMR